MFRVGSLIEQPAFYPYLSGRDNLRVFAAAGQRTPIESVSTKCSTSVGLTDRARDKVKTYSLGMKQRLGIAAALLSDPELLLLDEPANGLDPAGIVAMRELLRYLTSTGKTVLVSSHILPEVQQLADVVGIIDRGRLVREGPIEQLLAEGAQVRVLRAAGRRAARAAAALAMTPARGARRRSTARPPGGSRCGIGVASAPREVNRLLADERHLRHASCEAGNDLESVFLSLTTARRPARDRAARRLGPALGGRAR